MSTPEVQAKALDEFSKGSSSKLSADFTTSDGSSYTGEWIPRREDETPDVKTRKTGDPFTKQKPVMLFALGYDAQDSGADFDGIILIMQKPQYTFDGIEIWRRDKLIENKYTKLGIASIEMMDYEKAQLKQYILDSLGASYEHWYERWLIFVDIDASINKLQPHLYEYKIRAVLSPESFDFTMEDIIDVKKTPISALELSRYNPESGNTVLGHISTILYGGPEYDWVVALLNPEIDYFTDDQLALIDAINSVQEIKSAANLDDVNTVLQQLIIKYGIVAVVEKIFNAMGKISEDFLRALIEALSISFNAVTPEAIITRGDASKLQDFSRVFKGALQDIKTKPKTQAGASVTEAAKTPIPVVIGGIKK